MWLCLMFMLKVLIKANKSVFPRGASQILINRIEHNLVLEYYYDVRTTLIGMEQQKQ